MVKVGDKVILRGEVVEIGANTALITLTGGMNNLVAAPLSYVEIYCKIPDEAMEEA